MSDSGNDIVKSLCKKLGTDAKDATDIRDVLNVTNLAMKDALENLRIIAYRARRQGNACNGWINGGGCICGFCLLSQSIYILDRWNDRLPL